MAEGFALPTPADEPAQGRSLWVDARRRLFRNRAAVASILALLLITIACIVGPEVTGHRFDQVYTDYSRTPASLTAYPRDQDIAPAIERIGSRVRGRPESISISGDLVRVVLQERRPGAGPVARPSQIGERLGGPAFAVGQRTGAVAGGRARTSHGATVPV